MRRKAKAKTKQNIRRASPRFAPLSLLRLLYGNGRIAGMLGIAFVISLVWYFNFFQYGYQKVAEKAEKIIKFAGFSVRDIVVEGREKTDPAIILSAVGIRQGDSIFKCDPYQTKARLDTMAWVQSATVQRRLPDTIYIRLVERQPIALWQKNAKLYLIDGEGKILDGIQSDSFPHLLVITGDKAPQNITALLKALNDYPELKKRVKAATFISGRRWDIILDNNVKVKLPEKAMPQALEKLKGLEKQNHLTDGKAVSIDMRLPDRSFVYIDQIGDTKKSKENIT